MLEALLKKEEKIAVIGLGYVGLPLALAFARKFSVVGFDIDRGRVERMRRHEDPSAQLEAIDFENRDIVFTHDEADLKAVGFYVVTVPTPVNEHKVPDLSALEAASASVGRTLKEGNYVVFESTVYPGCTEEDCLPILETCSGLRLGAFRLGYSPERISPGNPHHSLTEVAKIVSGADAETTEQVARVYESIINAEVYRAPSIKVAEAAKIIENTQRDLNISLMNELSMIFDRMQIDTQEVIKAASTKWNFIPMSPGLVGGHCIGVDPYYLLYKARQYGYDPQVILSGRRVNDGMPAYVAKRLIQILTGQGKNPAECRALVMGITFKENVADIRNSKVTDLVGELRQFHVEVQVHDPYADRRELFDRHEIELMDDLEGRYDAVVVAVGHQSYRELSPEFLESLLLPKGILMDLKSLYDPLAGAYEYWSL